MSRRLAIIIAMLGLADAGLAAETELPAQDTDDSFEVEPPLLIPYRPPNEPGTATALATPAPPADIEKLTRDFERARRSAASAERLYKMGALAKVEAEQRALKAVRLKADLENARLIQAKAATVAQDETNEVLTEVAKAEAAPSDAALARAIEAAHAAVKKRQEAELQAAEINLARQQKLLSLGSGRKSDVAKAERKLAELKAGQN
jgi:hypothetical protein